jgi:hypothetical protein
MSRRCRPQQPRALARNRRRRPSHAALLVLGAPPDKAPLGEAATPCRPHLLLTLKKEEGQVPRGLAGGLGQRRRGGVGGGAALAHRATAGDELEELPPGGRARQRKRPAALLQHHPLRAMLLEVHPALHRAGGRRWGAQAEKGWRERGSVDSAPTTVVRRLSSSSPTCATTPPLTACVRMEPVRGWMGRCTDAGERISS